MIKLGLYGVACVIALMLSFGIAARTAGKNAQDEQTGADLTKFRNYLEEVKPGKKWQTGPARMDSEEIRKAFGQLRFYYVFSSPPMPPGAPLQELLDEHAQKVDEYQKQFISLTCKIDEQGRITPLYGAEEYNPGMMRVTTDEDAKICAAAILSLYGYDRVGPEIVAAKEVAVTRSENGWSCNVLRENAFRGEVSFDRDGRCVYMMKAYAGSLPPRAYNCQTLESLPASEATTWRTRRRGLLSYLSRMAASVALSSTNSFLNLSFAKTRSPFGEGPLNRCLD
jgi:hypothetical protein